MLERLRSSRVTRGTSWPQARGPRLARSLRRHWLFLALFAVGAALRFAVQATYEPAIFFADAFYYLDNAYAPEPDTRQPLGYSTLVVRPLLDIGDLALIPAVQHLLGLAMAVAVYAALVRHRVRTWVAALAAAPVLLDAYQLQIEENIASDTLLQTLIVGALICLTWRRHPPPAAMAAAGLLVGTSATVRFVGMPLLAVPVVYALVMSPGWRRRVGGAALAVLAGLVPLLVYASWTFTQTGEFRPGGDQTSGRFLQARVSPFADCSVLAQGGAPRHVLQLCPEKPVAERPQSVKYYTTHPPFNVRPDIDLPRDVSLNDARREFAQRVIANQPLEFTQRVLSDFARGFAWERTHQPGDWPLTTWHFPEHVRHGLFDRSEAVQRYGGSGPHVDETTAFFRDYQSVVYTRGPVFVAGLVFPVLAALLAAVGLPAPRRDALWARALLVGGTCAGVLLAAAIYDFSWRYQLPAVPLFPWSAALGLAALFPALRESRRHRVG